MCPVCLTTAVLIAGSVISTGGLAAITIKKFGGKNAPDKEKNDDPGNDYRSQDRNP